MDNCDRAQKVSDIDLRVALSHHAKEGPKPVFMSVCLTCGEPIEKVTLEDAAKARRWCCADCRDAWELEHER